MLRRPVWAVYVFVVGLALHNFVMAELWDAGIHGSALDAISAWKDTLLVVCLAGVWARIWRRFDWRLVDVLALAYAAAVVVWSIIPQHLLGGHATHRGIVLGAREDLIPVGAYFLGRGLALGEREFRRIATTILATAVGLAVFGLVDIFAIPLSWWRGSGAPGWFRYQLGFNYGGLSYLPQNFVYNTGNGHIYRRLVSTFLSPLATSYVFVVAVLLAVAWLMRRRPSLVIWVPVVAVILAGLLWTHSRSSELALALGLCAFAVVRPRAWLPMVATASVVLVISVVFVKAYPHVAPKTSFTATEIKVQDENAKQTGKAAVSGEFTDSSISSHWASLKAGIATDVHHPQGFGVGNSGSTAERTGLPPETGESTYTQLGSDAGLLGAFLFIAWSLVLLRVVLPCTPWIGAAFVAVFALALQTDVLGVPWLAYVLWILGGAVVTAAVTRPFETGPSYQ
jgi:hypothetical protein